MNLTLSADQAEKLGNSVRFLRLSGGQQSTPRPLRQADFFAFWCDALQVARAFLALGVGKLLRGPVFTRPRWCTARGGCGG